MQQVQWLHHQPTLRPAACRRPAGGKDPNPWRWADAFVFEGVVRCLVDRHPFWQRAVAAMRLVSRHWQRGVSEALPAAAPRPAADAIELVTLPYLFPHVKIAWLAAPELGMPAAAACKLLEWLAYSLMGLQRLFLVSWPTLRAGHYDGWDLGAGGLAALQHMPHLRALSIEGPWTVCIAVADAAGPMHRLTELSLLPKLAGAPGVCRPQPTSGR